MINCELSLAWLGFACAFGAQFEDAALWRAVPDCPKWHIKNAKAPKKPPEKPAKSGKATTTTTTTAIATASQESWPPKHKPHKGN